MLEDYKNIEAVKQLLGSNFIVRNSEGDITIKLKKVLPLKETDKFKSYSILFHGDKASFLPQSTYKVVHPSIDETELFIVPVGETQEAIQYQACFSYTK